MCYIVIIHFAKKFSENSEIDRTSPKREGKDRFPMHQLLLTDYSVLIIYPVRLYMEDLFNILKYVG